LKATGCGPWAAAAKERNLSEEIMPEFRQNPITKEWVIIATERARRPHEFAAKEKPKAIPSYVATCPFCPGNEHMTPPESYRDGDGSGWQVRVTPNKFSALALEGARWRHCEGLKRSAAGVGIHEVIVETPDHSLTTALMPLDQVERILRCYKQRYYAITEDPRIELITVFKNHGASAGTSLEHPHSQLIATPIISSQVRSRMEEALRYFDEAGECIFCRLMVEELGDQKRIVAENGHFVAFVPYASLSPFTIMIFPRRHMASFGQISDEEIAALAAIQRDTLARLYYGLQNPDFNYNIRTAPSECRYVRYFHWYLSVIPRLTKVAGFELGTGFFVNVSLPEENAEFLRGVKLPESFQASP
jgi:UDPglucose--hexose-1-phosphate uridylyltransferase